MRTFFNATRVVVLPKVAQPQYPVDFRPLSHGNVLYKCITKLLCSRLKVVLPYLVHDYQGAFVKRRELLYNVLNCQDLVSGYNRKHVTSHRMMKIELHKVFDSIHWDFLKDLLLSFKFPPQFVTWTLACVTLITFSLYLNGQLYGSYASGLGLRQGDPLSPLLFVLSMDYLSRLFIHSSSKHGFKFHPYCKSHNLIHLMFAEALILFYKVNMHKSQMVSRGC